MKFDLHMHTSRHSHDGQMDPFELLVVAKQNGLDGVVITEHDYWWPDEELEELQAKAAGLLVFAGMEVTAREGDVLCYGIEDPSRLKRGMLWTDLCQEMHDQGGVAVAAHPFRWGQHFNEILEDDSIHLDGMEMMSKNMDFDLRTLARKYAESHPQYAQLGNSDSHDVSTLGCCHTLFETRVRSIKDIVKAIQQKKCRAVEGRPG